jgi:hypothetical protein
MLGIVVAPQFLARFQGYRVEQLAPLLLPLALATLAAGPLAWWTCCRFDPRLSLSLGLASFAVAAACGVFLSPDWAAPELLWPLVLIGVGQPFSASPCCGSPPGKSIRRRGADRGRGVQLCPRHRPGRRRGGRQPHPGRAREVSLRPPGRGSGHPGRRTSASGWPPRRAPSPAGSRSGRRPARRRRQPGARRVRPGLRPGLRRRLRRHRGRAVCSPPSSSGRCRACPRRSRPALEKDFTDERSRPNPVARRPASRRAFAPGTGRRVAIATASVAALAIAIAAGYGLWHRVTPFEATDNAYVRGDLTFVAAKVPGYVVEVATENNRRVAPGQVLARIDPRDYQAAVADAEATWPSRRPRPADRRPVPAAAGPDRGRRRGRRDGQGAGERARRTSRAPRTWSATARSAARSSSSPRPRTCGPGRA